jgi:hypothetical protein
MRIGSYRALNRRQKELYFSRVTPVKEKHKEGQEIALTFMKTLKIFKIFSEKVNIFRGELRLSQHSGQLDPDHFLSLRKIENQKGLIEETGAGPAGHIS